MDKKMTGSLLGGLLVLIALILAVAQHYELYNFYGDASNKWYFYGLVGVIGLVGIVIAAWYYIKK